MCRAVSLQSPVAMGTLKIHRLLWLFHSPKAHTFLCNNLHLQLWPRPNGEDAWCFQNPHVMFFIWFDILDVYLYIYIYRTCPAVFGMSCGSQPTHCLKNQNLWIFGTDLLPRVHLDQDCSPLSFCARRFATEHKWRTPSCWSKSMRRECHRCWSI